jgi:hypothetical protein
MQEHTHGVRCAFLRLQKHAERCFVLAGMTERNALLNQVLCRCRDLSVVVAERLRRKRMAVHTD